MQPLFHFSCFIGVSLLETQHLQATQTACLRENPSWSHSKCWFKGCVFYQINSHRSQTRCQISTINTALHTSLVTNSSFSCYDSRLGFNLTKPCNVKWCRKAPRAIQAYLPVYNWIRHVGRLFFFFKGHFKINVLGIAEKTLILKDPLTCSLFKKCHKHIFSPWNSIKPKWKIPNQLS